MTLHQKLVHAVTEHDRRESTRAGYNRYALPQYLEALHSAEKYIAAGAPLREVLVGHFNGRLLNRLLRVAGELPTTRSEQYGSAVRRTNY